MQDLKDSTALVHYENYRCRKLAGVVNSPDPKKFNAPSRYIHVGSLCCVTYYTIITIIIYISVWLGVVLVRGR